ncbi:hypothetical protein pb186bvf_015653 [Paramecium bursaria]
MICIYLPTNRNMKKQISSDIIFSQAYTIMSVEKNQLSQLYTNLLIKKFLFYFIISEYLFSLSRYDKKSYRKMIFINYKLMIHSQRTKCVNQYYKSIAFVSRRNLNTSIIMAVNFIYNEMVYHFKLDKLINLFI